MNKLILIALCVAIVAGKIDFDALKGFNPIECIKSAATFLSDAKTFVNHVQSNPLDVPTDIQEIKQLLVDINDFMPKCGLQGEIQPYVGDFMIHADSSDCIADIEALVAVVQKVVTDIQGKDFVSLITDVQTLISQIESTLASCQGQTSTPIAQRLLQATTSKNSTINATDCMMRATNFVATVQTVISVNGSQILDIDTAIYGLHSTILASYNVMYETCGTGNIGAWLNTTLPPACLTSLRDAAIVGHSAVSQMQTNMWGAFSQMSSALNSWSQAHNLCPFMSNSTQPLQAALF